MDALSSSPRRALRSETSFDVRTKFTGHDVKEGRGIGDRMFERERRRRRKGEGVWGGETTWIPPVSFHLALDYAFYSICASQGNEGASRVVTLCECDGCGMLWEGREGLAKRLRR